VRVSVACGCGPLVLFRALRFGVVNCMEPRFASPWPLSLHDVDEMVLSDPS
jgi:hypothetical protein